MLIIKIRLWIICLLLGYFSIGCSGKQENITSSSSDPSLKKYPLNELKRVKQELMRPPFLPEHDQLRTEEKPRIVEVRLEIEEKKWQIDEKASIWAMTYNGSVPGPMIVVHEGDYVELTLVNPKTNTMLHNIDFHASVGALGGADLTQVSPGEEAVLRFRATKSGVFIYHCAPGGIQIPFHVVSGMNGAIMVLPRKGLQDRNGKLLKYDRAYYIGEQDFYIPKDKKGVYREYDTPDQGMNDMLEVMSGLIPTHIVFNGRLNSLTGENALKAKVGETVLVIHSQANRNTGPHLIGGRGDYVWETGSFDDPPATNLETWFIRGGSAGAFLYTFRQPGTYVYLNHNLIESFQLGAMANFNVEGQWNDDLMKQVKEPTEIK